MKIITITIEDFNYGVEGTLLTKTLKLENNTVDLIKGINLLGEYIKVADDVVQSVEHLP